jgi:predicted TIM-barrel fold metal-dependent hydrolase
MWREFVRLSTVGSGRSFDEEMSAIAEAYDPDGEKLLRALEESGIDKAVIFPSSDYDLLQEAGLAGVSIEERNSRCYALAAQHPDRFIPFFSVDPRRRNASELLLEGLDRHGVKGLKLLPGSGFFPQDRVVYPLYEIASERGVPVLFHSGPLVSPMKSKFAAPLNYDEVAADFPDLPIVMAHSGFGYWPISVSIAQNKANIYLELSGWQSFCTRDPHYFYRSVRSIVSLITSRRVLFGTDSPFLTRVLTHKEYIDALTNPPEDIVKAGLELKEAELDDILGGNALRLLSLSSEPK